MEKNNLISEFLSLVEIDSFDKVYKTDIKGDSIKKVDLSFEWIDLMIDCIAAGSKFNTYRMLDEYKEKIRNIP